MNVWKIKYNYLRVKRFFHIDNLELIKNKNVLFIHIPKAAGMTIATQLYDGNEIGHFPASDWKASQRGLFNSCYKFTFVRNPWDRVYSAYNFLKKGGMEHHKHDKQFKLEVIDKYSDFNDFVINYLTEETIFSYIHFYPQYYFVFDKNDELLVDDVYKVESIDSDIKKLQSLGVSLENIVRNASGSFDYKDVYNQESIDRISLLYKKDIEFFEYGF